MIRHQKGVRKHRLLLYELSVFTVLFFSQPSDASHREGTADSSPGNERLSASPSPHDDPPPASPRYRTNPFAEDLSDKAAAYNHEKLALEKAWDRSLEKHYQSFLMSRVPGSYIEFCYDKLNKSRRLGLILAGAVGPVLFASTTAGLLYFTFKDHGLSKNTGADEGASAILIGFAGGVSFLATQFIGTFYLVRSSTRLKKMRHLMSEEDFLEFDTAASWSLSVGPGGLGVEVRF